MCVHACVSISANVSFILLDKLLSVCVCVCVCVCVRVHVWLYVSRTVCGFSACDATVVGTPATQTFLSFFSLSFFLALFCCCFWTFQTWVQRALQVYGPPPPHSIGSVLTWPCGIPQTQRETTRTHHMESSPLGASSNLYCPNFIKGKSRNLGLNSHFTLVTFGKFMQQRVLQAYRTFS